MKTAFLAVYFMLALQIFSETATAQSIDTLKARYNNETLHFFRGYIAKGQNEERIRNTDLKNEFAMSPEGAKEFDQFRKKKTVAMVFSSVAFACIITGAIIEHNTPKNPGAGFLLGFGIGFDIVSLPFAFGSHKKLHHAIWLRNRDILFPVK